MDNEEPPKEEPEAASDGNDGSDDSTQGAAESASEETGGNTEATSDAAVEDDAIAPPPGKRFGGAEGEPPPDEPEKRNLKNKKIMASLSDELDDFGDLYSDDDQGDDSKSKKKKKKRKRKKKENPFNKHKGKLVFLSILAVIGYGYWYLTQPFIGTLGYGICKVFLERWVQYPQELRISTATQFSDSIRIWYVQTDSFGQYRMEQMQCYYANTPEKGFHLDKIELNRKEMDQQLVDDFNKSLPAIMMTEEYLHIPRPLPDSLENMKTDFYDGIL